MESQSDTLPRITTGRHYLLVHLDIPLIDAAAWRLCIGGEVKRAPRWMGRAPAGNRLTKTNYLNGATSNYGYDPLYELTQVTQGGSTTDLSR